MDDIGIHDKTEITTDGTGGSVLGIGRAHELPRDLDRFFARYHELDYRPGRDVLDETIVKRLAHMFGVIRGSLFRSDLRQFEPLDGQADTLKACDDIADVAIGNSIGFQHCIGSLLHVLPFLISQGCGVFIAARRTGLSCLFANETSRAVGSLLLRGKDQRDVADLPTEEGTFQRYLVPKCPTLTQMGDYHDFGICHRRLKISDLDIGSLSDRTHLLTDDLCIRLP